MRERAIMITFSVKCKEFDGNYERNKFFRELYGWKQIIRKEDKKYEYRREGLLDEIPNIRVDQSMFIIMKEHMERMKEFLEEWEDKINWNEFDVLLNEKQSKLLREWLDE
ncbi:MAG: hypothetical protein J4428_03340 [Candidatus Aenigmarchaeota archaeon]|nr:hypothetical protein [Candidatus Aenigmarchaeota archaeon]